MSSRRRRRRNAEPSTPPETPRRPAPAAPTRAFNPFKQKRFIALAVLMIVLLPFEWRALNTLLESPPGDSYDAAPALVVPSGSMHDPYLTIPPTSGARAENAPAGGVYTTELSNLDQVAALAEGTVLIQYSCPPGSAICAQMIAQLEEIVDEYPDRPLILAPYRAAANAHINLTAWGILLRLNQVDTEEVRGFIEAWAGAEVDSRG